MGGPGGAEDAGAASKQDSLIGRVINDRFTILEMIARGGMGRVYRARQEPLGREVALKVLDPRYHGDEDPEFQARFFLEASTAAKLTHPNTVTVFDYGKTSDEIYFIVMEMVEGRTLASLLKAEGALAPERAVHIALQMARSVREAHGLGVVHRDLKPANVIITTHADEEDFVKVLDFGLVKDLDDSQELTQQGLFMGSPKYMSPEQIQGGRVDARSDVYSLGVILFYMLTGRVPFEGSTQVQTLMAHVKSEVPPLERDDGVPIPVDLEALVLRTLAKAMDDRHPSMNDLILALKRSSGLMGVPRSSNHSISISGEYDARTLLMSTPSGGIPRVSSTPSGGMPTRPEPAVDGEGQTDGRGKKWALAAFAVLALGAGAYAATRGAEAEVVAAAPVVDRSEARGAAPTEPVFAAERTHPGPSVRGEEVAAPARCEVQVRSVPPGAEVFVGERSYGTTPARIVWVGESAEPGREVTFRFERSGYRTASVTRTVEADTLEVGVEMSRRFVPRRGGSRGPSAMGSAGAMDADDPSLPNGGSDYRDNPY